MEIDAPDPSGPFGPVIYAYSRAQAVADGVQVEVTKTAQEAGIRFPVFLTRAVFDGFVTVRYTHHGLRPSRLFAFDCLNAGHSPLSG